MTRRNLIKSAGFLLAGSQLPGAPAGPGAAYEWIRSTRTLIAEGYNPPFYPSLDYQPEKAVRIARELNADSLRYPAASYYAYFPAKSGYPVHPELQGDPMRRTVELSREAGLRNVAYVPLNHPFMEATSKDPRFADWSRKEGIVLHRGHQTSAGSRKKQRVEQFQSIGASYARVRRKRTKPNRPPSRTTTVNGRVPGSGDCVKLASRVSSVKISKNDIAAESSAVPEFNVTVPPAPTVPETSLPRSTGAPLTVRLALV